MIRIGSKILGILLVVALVCSMMACLADRSEKAYEKIDGNTHLVIETIWGDGSSKVKHEKEYTEPHTFENGVCIYCGAAEESNVEGTFTSASGAELTKGMTAAAALSAVVSAISGDVELPGVDAAVAQQLLDLIKSGASQEELLAVLASFPVQTVDGVECYVVTLSYTDANGAAVTENYAFSTADGTLVKVF